MKISFGLLIVLIFAFIHPFNAFADKLTIDDILDQICVCLDEDYEKANKPKDLDSYEKVCVRKIPLKLMKTYNDFSIEKFSYLLVYDHLENKISVEVKYKDKKTTRNWFPTK